MDFLYDFYDSLEEEALIRLREMDACSDEETDCDEWVEAEVAPANKPIRQTL